MAGLAGLGKSALHMVRIGGLLKVGQMAAHAVGRSAGEFSSDMAGVALESCMRSGQGKAGEFQMIEFGAEPVIHTVALFAGGGKSSGDVARAGCALVVLGVTRVALGG